MSYYSLRHPEEFERKSPVTFPTPDHDIEIPKCCGVWMQDDGGNYYYCDECGNEVAK